MKSIIICWIATLVACAQSGNVGVVIGGIGGGNSIEIIGDGFQCDGSQSNPPIPLGPSGNLIGWLAEYHDGTIYLCGGQDSNIHNECYYLNIGSSSWVLTNPMVASRRYAASVTMPDGRLVILGGYNTGSAWLDTVEVKEAGNGKPFNMVDGWKLPRKMFDLCAVAINNTHIFIAGGSMYGKPQVEAADILDTTTNTWHSLPNMPLARSAPGCILTEVNGESGILVTGGLNSEQLEQTKRTEFLSLSTHKWTQLENLVQDRMGHNIFQLGAKNKLTVVGGYSQTEGQLFGVETYTEGQGWRKSSALKFARYFYGSCEVPEDLVTC